MCMYTQTHTYTPGSNRANSELWDGFGPHVLGGLSSGHIS